MEAKIAILFIGKKSRTTRHKQIPIYLRVTIDKKRFEVATHRHVEPSLWSPSAGRVKGKSDTAVDTNMALDMITKKSMITEINSIKKTESLQLTHSEKNGLARIGINEPYLVVQVTSYGF